MSTEPEELKALETALAGLIPAPTHLDRDGLMYSAGRAAVSRRPGWLAAGGFAGVAAILAIWLSVRPPQTVERTVYVTVRVPEPTAATAPDSPARESEPVVLISHDASDRGPLRNPQLEMRRQLLERGDILETLPATSASAAPPLVPLEKDLGFSPGSFERRRDSSSNPW